MKWQDIQTESMKLQWNFYERTINNYSIIMRIMSSAEKGLLVSHVPRVFVEESFFDMCKIVINDGRAIQEGFYSIDDTLTNLDYASLVSLDAGSSTSSVVEDAFDYGMLYIYPLKKKLKTIGYLVLGKRYHFELDMGLVRELQIVCDIYNKSLLMSNGAERRSQQATTFEMVLEAFPDPVVLIDKKGYISYANVQAKAQFETKKGFLIGERADRAIPGLPEDLVLNNTSFSGEIDYKSRDDYRMYRVESFSVSSGKDGDQWRAIVFRDVVDAKVNDEEHFVKRRNESVGMLAGGIAHDFNNMLTGILGYAALMRKLTSDPQAARYAEAIEHSAQRASSLTRHLLNFSRRQKKSTGLVDINALLEDVLFLLKKSFYGVRIERDLDTTLPHTVGDEAELQNVFLNLFINARDAMSEDGLLKVTTKRPSSDLIRIDIEDNGHGIDKALRHRIFEPYFSTKKDSSNLGMGLYLVDKVIRRHGGFIEIASEKDKGTVFSLYLPVTMRRSAATKRNRKPAAKASVHNRTILVVDDEYLVRELLKGVLTANGATVFEAESGEDALAIHDQKKGKIELVVLDMIMPGIKGDEVLKRLRSVEPALKVIISSGFMSEEQREKLGHYGVDGFLDKPFKDDEALQMISDIINN